MFLEGERWRHNRGGRRRGRGGGRGGGGGTACPSRREASIGWPGGPGEVLLDGGRGDRGLIGLIVSRVPSVVFLTLH